jgi:hypothetical protein
MEGAFMKNAGYVFIGWGALVVSLRDKGSTGAWLQFFAEKTAGKITLS